MDKQFGVAVEDQSRTDGDGGDRHGAARVRAAASSSLLFSGPDRGKKFYKIQLRKVTVKSNLYRSF